MSKFVFSLNALGEKLLPILELKFVFLVGVVIATCPPEPREPIDPLVGDSIFSSDLDGFIFFISMQ